MFNQPTQIPRSPLASTLTLVFHACLGLAVLLVTALPSIPRDHHVKSLTYIVAEPLPDLRFDVPKPIPPPAPPKLEMPKPEPPKAFDAPVIPRPTPPPPPPAPAPAPAPEKRVIEPPKEIPIPKPAVTVGAFADATTARRTERVAEVATVDFEAAKSDSARVKHEVHTIDGFDAAATRTATSRATVADAGFGATTPTQTTQRPTLTATNAGFGAEITRKPAPAAPRATAAAGFGADVTARPAPAAPKPPALGS
jgi:hypothetical protein